MLYRVYVSTPLFVALIALTTAFWQPTAFAKVSPSTTISQQLNLDSAINKAGRQRMLTQRITKAWMLIGQDVATEQAQKQLDSGVALFESQLEELEAYAPNAAVETALANVRQEWNTFRLQAIAVPDRKKAQALISSGNELLSACESAVKTLEALSAGNKGKLINVSGRQRMLSQRIGMLYTTHSWGVGNGATEQAFRTAVQEFGVALGELLSANENTPELRKALEKVESQWEFSRAGFDMMGSHHFVPYVIQSTTESILGKMDAITHQYEVLNP